LLKVFQLSPSSCKKRYRWSNWWFTLFFHLLSFSNAILKSKMF